MQTIFVTGGAGYIGSHACKALARDGYVPVAFDDLSQGHEDAVKWGPLEVGDLRDAERLDAVLAEYQPAAVMHFAGRIAAGESVTDPGQYYEANVAGTVALLQAMRKAGVDRIVYSSSAAVYGEPNWTPIREDHPLAPTSPYGRSKLMCEQILQDYVSAYDFVCMSFRYFNASGADTDGELGERHDPETHLIPLVLDAAAGRRTDISIFGNDYDTADGTCIRDYVHVTDLAAAHVLGLSRVIEGSGYEAINLGNGTGYSVAEVVATAERIVGKRIAKRMQGRRPGDPAVLISDIERAKRVLGWQPVHTDLADQIASAWKWCRDP